MAKLNVRCPRCGTAMDCDDCTRVGSRWVDVYLCPKCGTKHNAVQSEPEGPRESPRIKPEIARPEPPMAQPYSSRAATEARAAESSPLPDLDDWDEDDLSDVAPPPASMPRLVPENGSLPSIDEFEALAEARRLLEQAKQASAEAKRQNPNGHVFLEVLLERAMLWIMREDGAVRRDIEAELRDSAEWERQRLVNPQEFKEYPLA